MGFQRVKECLRMVCFEFKFLPFHFASEIFRVGFPRKKERSHEKLSSGVNERSGTVETNVDSHLLIGEQA